MFSSPFQIKVEISAQRVSLGSLGFSTFFMQLKKLICGSKRQVT